MATSQPPGNVSCIGAGLRGRIEVLGAHVLLHGVYRRGRIASALREAGFSHPNTDFIHAAGNGFLAR